MENRLTRYRFLPLFLLSATACVSQSGPTENSPIMDAQACPAAKNTLGLENAKGKLADLNTVEQTGTLSYREVEFSYAISEGDKIRTFVRAKQKAGASPKFTCSAQASAAYPKGTDLTVTMNLPTTRTEVGYVIESFMVEATDSYVALASRTISISAIEISEFLAINNLGEFRFYDMGKGIYELRIAAQEQIDEKYSAQKRIVIRYQYTADTSPTDSLNEGKEFL